MYEMMDDTWNISDVMYIMHCALNHFFKVEFNWFIYNLIPSTFVTT